VLASHLARELEANTHIEGGPDLLVIPLTANEGMLAADTHKADHEDVFAAQLRDLVQPEDVVIAMSRTGRALSVLKAVAVARQAGATTIGFTGTDGGLLAKVVDIPIIIPEGAKEQIEDAHVIIQHIICTTMRESQLEGDNALEKSRQALYQSLTPED
jgi:D-sedoheptulose 7-phosphate isomerase